MILVLSPFAAVDRWAVGAQLHARRNAMIASTRLAQRRAERVEVEEFLAAHARASAHRAPTAISERRFAHG